MLTHNAKCAAQAQRIWHHEDACTPPDLLNDVRLGQVTKSNEYRYQ